MGRFDPDIRGRLAVALGARPQSAAGVDQEVLHHYPAQCFKSSTAVGPVVLGEAVAEVGQHVLVEAWGIQLQSQDVLEVDAAAHRLGRPPVAQIVEEL